MVISVFANLVQHIGILVPFAGCVSLVKRAHSRTSMYLLLANLGCLIINGSYLLLLRSKTHEGAFTALKMEYFGNVVFYLMFGLFLWTYMKLKNYKWAVALVSAWSIFDVVFLFQVWTEDHFHLVFENLEFVWPENRGLVMMQVEPGTLYMLHYCIIGSIGLCALIYILVRLFLVQIPTERRNLARLAASQAVLCASLSIMLLLNLPFDIVPICASLSILFIIISVHRDEFFDVTELGHGWIFGQMGDAFVIVDKMYGYLESNSCANRIFPELNTRRKNEIVSADLLRLFMSEEDVVQLEDMHYRRKVMELQDKRGVSGYGLLLSDMTQQYELLARVQEEKERADAANQAKSAFVSNVSHELRTPMNAVVGMTQILLRRDLPRQEREYLLNIQNSGNALLAIVNDLLDMSKIESGKMELVDEAYDFCGMLNDLGMIILNRIGTKPVELIFDIDSDIPARLYGDALRIRQIIINLMNNATKFTEEGCVRLRVKVGEVREDDMELLISVSDTGQGIREEDMGKLFGTFQQVDVEKNHHKEGTGLGLSISKQLVELMGGTIGVTSEYGKGSEFYFTIHQRVVDRERAVMLPPGQEESVIAGHMKNPEADAMLKKLAESCRLVYEADPFSDTARESADGKPCYYFTDCLETLGKQEREALGKRNAVLCVLHNPMADGDLPEGLPVINKPLYTYSFCRFLQDGGEETCGAEEGREGTKDVAGGGNERDTTASGAGFSVGFTAPDARILVVDDNDINRMIAEEMLLPLQAQVDTAADGEQALKKIGETRYDLIFMDHLMPVMDGVEAVRALRSRDEDYCREVPVIALTANADSEQKEEYRKAGMSDHLPKPIDMEQLYAVIRKWIPGKIRPDNSG